MSKGIRKAIIGNNPKVRQMAVTIDGASATPVAAGLDSSQILSVTDTGTGDYTIIFKYPFHPSHTPIVMVSSLTVGVQAYVTAVAYDRVTVEGMTMADGTTVANCDFDMLVIGNDGRIQY